MKKLFLLTALFLNSAFAKDLSFKQAEKIVDNSFYVSFHSDTDYSKADNIIQSSLAGLYLAYLSGDFPKGISASSVVDNSNKAKFKNLPKPKTKNKNASFNIRIEKAAMDKAAPYFTGYKIAKHYAPKADGFFFAEDVYFDGKAYYLYVDDIGSPELEWKLENVKAEGKGYLLTGFTKYIDDKKSPKKPFSLKIVPSDVNGAWKRVKFNY